MSICNCTLPNMHGTDICKGCQAISQERLEYKRLLDFRPSPYSWQGSKLYAPVDPQQAVKDYLSGE